MFRRSLWTIINLLVPMLAMSCVEQEVSSLEPQLPQRAIPDHINKEEAHYDPFNLPPNTFIDISPPETVYRNEAFFRWIGTDLDGDVVGYQHQLVETDEAYFLSGGLVGEVLRSIDPPSNSGDENWTPQSPDGVHSFFPLDDLWYEFRARCIDDAGAADTTPATRRFRVLFDEVIPEPVIGTVDEHGQNDQMCGRLNGVQFHTFLINATDESHNSVTPRGQLQYRVQLRATSQTSCVTHLADPFTDWQNFADDGDQPVEIGAVPPTLYNDLFPAGCSWLFTLQVRDPAGNQGTVTCIIEQNE